MLSIPEGQTAVRRPSAFSASRYGKLVLIHARNQSLGNSTFLHNFQFACDLYSVTSASAWLNNNGPCHRSGILIASLGVVPLYWIDAASYLAVVYAALQMKTVSKPAASRAPVRLADAFEGLRFVFKSKIIASTMVLDFFATFFGAATTLMPIFANDILGVGAQGYGFMRAAPAVGAFVAALFLTSRKIRRQGPVLLVAVAVFGLATAIFGASTWYPLTLVALAITGTADTVSMVIRGTLRQLLTPDELRGRMTAVNMVFVAGGPQLGEFVVGLTASVIGAPVAVLIGGTLCVLLVGGTALRTPELRQFDTPEHSIAKATG